MKQICERTELLRFFVTVSSPRIISANRKDLSVKLLLVKPVELIQAPGKDGPSQSPIWRWSDPGLTMEAGPEVWGILREEL